MYLFHRIGTDRFLWLGFWLNTLLEIRILLRLSIANKCTIVVSEEHLMASFKQTEQCVNVAYLCGPLAINNNRMNCKH